jgi:hypothetical protein
MSEFPARLEVFLTATPPPNKDVFESVWKIVQECGEEERHFNQLQSVYRGIASTWLLATFGAVGYLLFGKDGCVVHPWMAAMVCLLGAFGVALLWMLDLSVYHRLLVAAFDEGKALEDYFAWLPKVRTNMLTYTHHAVRRRLALYYLFTTLGPLIAGISFFYYYNLRSVALVTAVVGVLLVGILFAHTAEKG